MNSRQPIEAFPGARAVGEQCHVLIRDDLQYAANDQHYAEQKGGGRLQCTLVVGGGSWLRPPKDAEIALFAFAAKQLHFFFLFLAEMRPGPEWEAGLPGVQGNDFPESGEERSSSKRGARTGKKCTDVQSCPCFSNQITTFLFFISVPTLLFEDSDLMFQAKLKGRRKSVGKKKKKVPTNKKKEKKEKKGAKKKK